MRCGGWCTGTFFLGFVAMAAGGCVSLDDHNRLKQKQRLVEADNVTLRTELEDERKVNDNLRNRVNSLEREAMTKDELLANLRKENDLLDGMRRMTQSELEKAAGRLGPITIEGSRLPPQLDSAIKRFADEHPTEVVYDAARGNVKWKADLIFPLGSDVVKESSMEALRGFTEILKSSAAADFEAIIIGHTDTRPIQRPETRAKHPTNWHLAAHRAISVSNVLQKYGYWPQRIMVAGCGEYRPVADNTTEAGNAMNRRVDVYLVPVGSITAAGSVASASPRGGERGATLAAPEPATTKRSTAAPKTTKQPSEEPATQPTPESP
ncbi:MAG: OmpA family protein [Planctomycetes bacterium]|nr:OmpA family protein [Planctomycetota bacterium]